LIATQLLNYRIHTGAGVWESTGKTIKKRPGGGSLDLRQGMGQIPLLWLLLISLLDGIYSLPRIQLFSPLFDATFMTIPPSTSATIPVQFEIIEENSFLGLATDIKVCLTLRSSDEVVFADQCLEAMNNNLNLQFVPVGPGTLELYVMQEGQVITTSLIQSLFRVVTMESALPLLIGPSALQFLANPLTDASDASIEFFLSDITLKDYLLVCLEVHDSRLLILTPPTDHPSLPLQIWSKAVVCANRPEPPHFIQHPCGFV
jgi:hypothetical protein